MEKYLNYNGLTTFWEKIKNKFPSKTDFLNQYSIGSDSTNRYGFKIFDFTAESTTACCYFNAIVNHQLQGQNQVNNYYISISVRGSKISGSILKLDSMAMKTDCRLRIELRADTYGDPFKSSCYLMLRDKNNNPVAKNYNRISIIPIGPKTQYITMDVKGITDINNLPACLHRYFEPKNDISATSYIRYVDCGGQCTTNTVKKGDPIALTQHNYYCGIQEVEGTLQLKINQPIAYSGNEFTNDKDVSFSLLPIFNNKTATTYNWDAGGQNINYTKLSSVPVHTADNTWYSELILTVPYHFKAYDNDYITHIGIKGGQMQTITVLSNLYHTIENVIN